MPQAKDDLEQIFDYFTRNCAIDSAARMAELSARLNILAHTPLLGKPLAQHRRELLIGKRRQIYAVEYEYVPRLDTVFIVSIRSRRQAPH